jgi:uncharacterized membrane protein YgcG
MTSRGKQTLAALIGSMTLLSAGCVVQDAPPPPPPPEQVAQAGPELAQAQLDELVAPVALYPDPLLVDILTASTYPLEIVEAERWLADPAHAALKGDALTAALVAQNWDPSVKSLVPFPAILQMLNGHLDWTQHLGEAFLAQQADVMDAVQRLRQRAQNAGALKSTPQETVTNDGGAIVISPPATQVVYVPSYDPWCIYGPWPYPPYPPFYYEPWSGYCGPGPWFIGFDVGLFWPFGFWEWGRFDWHHHFIHIDSERWGRLHPGHRPPGEEWRHDPGHRGLVPYRDPRNSSAFPQARDYHQSFRGYPGRDGEAIEPSRPAPSAFDHFAPGPAARAQSERGQSSQGGGSARSSGSSGSSGRGSSGTGRH